MEANFKYTTALLLHLKCFTEFQNKKKDFTDGFAFVRKLSERKFVVLTVLKKHFEHNSQQFGFSTEISPSSQRGL